MPECVETRRRAWPHLIHPVLQWRPNVASKLQDHHRDERLLKVRSRNEWNMELTKHVCTLVKLQDQLLYTTTDLRSFEGICVRHIIVKKQITNNTYIHMFIIHIYLLQHVPCMVYIFL